MNLNKKDMKNLMLLILFAVVVYVGIQKADVLLVFLRFLVGIAYPFLLGAAFAFVLNVPKIGRASCRERVSSPV